MAHPRQAIRTAVAAMLAGKTRAEDRVFTNRKIAWAKGDLPGLSIFTEEEESSVDDLQGQLRRVLKLGVVAVMALPDAVDDELDVLAGEIEDVLAADPKLNATAFDSFLSATAIEIQDEQAVPIAGVKLTFDVTYYTAPA